MSFFDNTRNAGLALTIIGLFMILGAVVEVYNGMVAEGGIGENVGLVIIAMGGLIAAVAYFAYGNQVRKGRISDKLDVLGNYVRIVGITTVIIGLFYVIGNVFSTSGDPWSGVVMVIFGLIAVFVAIKMLDDKVTTFDRIVWVILAVVFALLFLSSFISIFTSGLSLRIVTSLCYAVVYILMLVFLMDRGVRDRMGM